MIMALMAMLATLHRIRLMPHAKPYRQELSTGNYIKGCLSRNGAHNAQLGEISGHPQTLM